MSTLKITQNKIKPAVVASIEEGSIGEELGFEVGDRLISINGVKPRDLIDYKFLMAEENIQLIILDEKDKQHTIDIEKSPSFIKEVVEFRIFGNVTLDKKYISTAVKIYKLIKRRF